MYLPGYLPKAPASWAGHENVNRALIERGYGVFREGLGGAEQQAMHGRLGRLFGHYAEEMFFESDQHPLNPMRYLPTPFHTKLAQQRTPLSQYLQQEAVGARMRRWNRPLHDFLLPYLRGMIGRVTGQDVIPYEVEHRRDLDTLADMLEFLRAESEAGENAHERGRYRTLSHFHCPVFGNERTRPLLPFCLFATF